MRPRLTPRRALRGVVLLGVGLSAGGVLPFLGCSSDDGDPASDTTSDARAKRPPDVIFDEDLPLQCNDLRLMGQPVPARAAGEPRDAGTDAPDDVLDGGIDASDADADMDDAAVDASTDDAAVDASTDDAAVDASTDDASADASTDDASADASTTSEGGDAGVEILALHGGTITDGVYVLTETLVYGGKVANFDAQRETVRVTGETWDNVSEHRGAMTERSTFTFGTNGNELSLRNVCHDYPAFEGEFTLVYEATPDTLRIEVRLNADVGHYLYRKQP